MALENNNKYYLYCLIDPINNLPFYVGKGCGNRAFSHLKNLKNQNNALHIMPLENEILKYKINLI